MSWTPRIYQALRRASLAAAITPVPDLKGAACAGRSDLFDLRPVDSDDHAYREALALCARCPVLGACRVVRESASRSAALRCHRWARTQTERAQGPHMTNQLDGDDCTAQDVLDMLKQAVSRPREKAPKLPTLADSAELHKLAGQKVTVTQANITADGVEIETSTATLGRPVSENYWRTPTMIDDQQQPIAENPAPDPAGAPSDQPEGVGGADNPALDDNPNHEAAATIAGSALSPFTATVFPEITTAVSHLRDVLGNQTYESLARKGETMTTAAMVTYAYDQIDQVRTKLEAVSK